MVSQLFTQRSSSMILHRCVYTSGFTGLLSRNSCGVENPLTLSGTQRNDSAWDAALGNGDAVVERTGADEERSHAGEGWGDI